MGLLKSGISITAKLLGLNKSSAQYTTTLPIKDTLISMIDCLNKLGIQILYYDFTDPCIVCHFGMSFYSYGDTMVIKFTDNNPGTLISLESKLDGKAVFDIKEVNKKHILDVMNNFIGYSYDNPDEALKERIEKTIVIYKQTERKERNNWLIILAGLILISFLCFTSAASQSASFFGTIFGIIFGSVCALFAFYVLISLLIYLLNFGERARQIEDLRSKTGISHNEGKDDNTKLMLLFRRGLIVLCILSVVFLAFGIYSSYSRYLKYDTNLETENIPSEEIFLKQDYIIADVKGHVKSVNTEKIRYTFQRNGLLCDYSSSWEESYGKLEKKIERDKDGYIERIYNGTLWVDEFYYDTTNKRLSKFINADDGGSTTITFTYDENGNVIREHVVDWITDLDGENEETKTHTVYIVILETDSKGNWTKRKYNDKIQTRTIEYY